VRLLFFILLLANVSLFGYFTYREQGTANAKPYRPPVNADRIRLVNPSDAPMPSSKAVGASAKFVCMEWTGLKAEDIDPARQALDKLALGEKLSRGNVEEYWLHIPPQKTKKDAEKKLAELVGLGIDDAQVIADPPTWRWAISFPAQVSEDLAIVRLNQLKEKGVKSAKILKRDAPGNTFNIVQVDEKIRADLNQLKTTYSGTELKEIECKTP